MTEGNAPTRLSLRDLRRDALHRLLLSPRGRVASIDEILGLSDLFSWPSAQVRVAIGDLIAGELLVQDAHGRLIVRRTAA